MNIGIDIDDTIVNTYEMFVKLICMKYSLDFNDLISKKLDYFEICKLFNISNDFSRDLHSVITNLLV